jgi:RNA polymerase sigma factor (sigma-70 family)
MIAYMERRGLYPQEVDDALSESFRRFHRQARRLDPARSPEGWIRNIVSGEITRELLHRKSLEEGWDNLELAEQIARDPAVGTANPDPQFDNEHLMDPLDILIQQEELPEAQQEVGAWFKATFSKLQRDVFLAVMDEGLPYHEVSKRLHIPEFKIQDIMKLMRRKIRERAGWVSNRSPTLF